MTHLHAKQPDNVRVIQPGERSHLLAGRVHHDRRRDLDGNACETAPGHRQLRQRQLARAVSACTQRKAPQTTKIVAERVVRALTFSGLHVLSQTHCTVGARA